jgi:putative DNA primase/helicase
MLPNTFFDRARWTTKPLSPSAHDDIDTHTDRWASAQFAQLWSRTLRRVVKRGLFVKWDGTRWRVSHRDELESLAKQTVDHWLADAVAEEDRRRRGELLEFARRMCSLTKLRALIELAASEETLWTPPEQFDAQPHLFNCANATIDLRTGEPHAHDHDDFITRVSPIRFNPEATAPRWIEFVDEVFANRLDLIQFVQRAVGYTLTGETSEHVFFLLHGTGCNGKSLFIRVLARVLGEYARTAAIETFTMKRPNAAQASPDLAALAGARLVSAGETEAGARLSEGLIKSLSGADEITCRNLNEHLFTYLPAFKVWLFFNHRPQIRGVDAGIWRRVRLIPFTVSFEGRADKQLEAKLMEEAPGILAWAVRGAVEWYRSGLGTADAVSEATANYRDESDLLGPFLDARCEFKPNATISRKCMTTMYAEWCQTQGEEPLKTPTFYRLLQDREGIMAFKSDGERGFKGIKERQS